MTLRSDHYDDVYFSAQDGFAETSYVFLDGNDLSARFADIAGEFVIAETGFGTGLNFLAAMDLFERVAPNDARLHFISFEKHPLYADVMRDVLSQWRGDLDIEAMLARYPDGGMVSDRVKLTLVIGDVNDEIIKLNTPVDAWFLDGFRPSSNPDMWSDIVFEHMARLSKIGGTFATFTAAVFVRRGLMAAGYSVSKIKGFGHKRDMSVGVLR